MTELRARLNSAWGVLSRPGGQELSTFPLSSSHPEIRAAVDHSGRRHLLIAGDDSAPVEPSVGVLAIEFRQLVFGHVGRAYLDICCTDPALNIEFQEVAVDILESVVAAVEPVAEALKVIDRWRRLLRAGAASLRDSERIGLFAELSVLVTLNESGADVPASCWTGPLRAAHDFELTERCLEVKGIGYTSSAIRVHGFEQLAQHDGRPLHLVLASVELDPAGTTIPYLIQRLRGLSLTTKNSPRDCDRRASTSPIR